MPLVLTHMRKKLKLSTAKSIEQIIMAVVLAGSIILNKSKQKEKERSEIKESFV